MNGKAQKNWYSSAKNGSTQKYGGLPTLQFLTSDFEKKK
jgi:hypothetical protein